MTVFDEATPLELIQPCGPTCWSRARTTARTRWSAAEFVESYGGRVHLARLRDGYSTTRLMEQMRAAYDLEPSCQRACGIALGRGRADCMNIAVFLPNWIGDVVMATPALRALRQHFPRPSIIGVVKPYVAGVLDGLRLVRRADPARSHGPLGAAAGRRRLAAAPRAHRPGRAVSELVPLGLVAWLGGCRRRVGYARYGRSLLLTDAARRRSATPTAGCKPSPIIDAYNRLAEPLGCPRPATAWSCSRRRRRGGRRPRLAASRLGRLSARSICLNPGAAFGAAKHWPAEYVRRAGPRPGPSSAAAACWCCAARPSATWPGRSSRRPGRPRRRRLASADAAAVARADQGAASAVRDLLVTTDSGPRHFAAAFDRPVVTLFGPTHIAWTETYHPRAIHLQKQVPCGPCQQRVCPLDHAA